MLASKFPILSVTSEGNGHYVSMVYGLWSPDKRYCMYRITIKSD